MPEGAAAADGRYRWTHQDSGEPRCIVPRGKEKKRKSEAVFDHDCNFRFGCEY